MIELRAHDSRPLWRQIQESLRDRVLADRLEPGDAVPSIRDLARRLRVNPATVAKAYGQMTADGLFEVRRGEGTFVATAAREQRQRGARERLERAALAVAAQAAALDLDFDGAVAALCEAWRVLDRQDPGRKEVLHD